MSDQPATRPALIRHAPNAVTVSRAGLGVIGALALGLAPAAESEAGAILFSLASGLLFALAALTDALDGWMARALRVESALGALLDPIADKVLTGAYLIAFLVIAGFDPWLAAPVLVILARDAAVTAARLSRLDRERAPLPVTPEAKLKTALLMGLIALPFAAVAASLPFAAADAVVAEGYYVWIGGLWLAAALSVFSGLKYRRA